jgi:mono/diheme cytochrome c family protein
MSGSDWAPMGKKKQRHYTITDGALGSVVTRLLPLPVLIPWGRPFCAKPRRYTKHPALGIIEFHRGSWGQMIRNIHVNKSLLRVEKNSMRFFYLLVIVVAAFSVSLTSLATAGETNRSNARSAAELYAKHCASCHGKDGGAKTLKAKLKHARDLTDRAWQDDASDERIFNAIMNGKRKMPGFSKKLSEPEIEALVSYVRALKK